ncbi:MAG: peptide ABC transporter permease [Gammaproteobacteria bacterium]|jgi:microcin C transport system permease protein|nr:peptide ABC transporter permease [Gammaproteobacteria bacterium]|tara:strand:+ start:777 stop:1790 length:1014 start_codon:yes stop_codon:yes gene_type:complete
MNMSLSFWDKFLKNNRNKYSLYIFIVLFVLSLFAEIISNDKPIILKMDDKIYFPILISYTDKEFGGYFDTEADYKDDFITSRLEEESNWAIFPINPHSYDSINISNSTPNPARPSIHNYLGTDDRGRDVLARLIYGFRLSVLFAFVLTAIGIIIGIFFGAIQGYFAGRVDLYMQRFIEIWSSMPELYILIIFSSLFEPSIFLLIILLSLFGWMSLSDYVRAEFLKGRNMEYVVAARTLGLSNTKIILKHILPNSMVSVITFLPFRISGAILILTSLDFLGLGVPPDTPSLGELLAQGKENIEAWWLSLSTFLVLVGTLLLLIFIGEGIRESLDSRSS